MKISIITCTYNSINTIESALDSFSAQSYSDKQHIIVDGASRDGTIEKIRTRMTNETVFVHEPDQGMYDALNKGMALARGEVLGILHSDDIYHDTDTLKMVAEAFDKNNYDAVYGDLVYVYQHNIEQIIRYWRSGLFQPAKLSAGWMPPHPTFFVRKKLVQKIGEYDLKFKIASDYDFMLRVLKYPGVQVGYIPRILVRMRTGGASNANIANIINKSREDFEILKKNEMHAISTLLLKNLAKIPQFFYRPKF